MILANRIALITGASRGVGAEIARQFATGGASVCVNYLNSPDAAERVVAEITQAGGTAFACRADVTDPEQVEAMTARILERWGRLDLIVNNALPAYRFDPAAPYTAVETVQWEHFETQFGGAVRGCLNTTRAALPAMKAQGFGKILNISTNLVYNPVVTYYDYTTAKAALIGLTRNLAVELGPHGIRVNLLAGGLLRTTDASATTTPEVFDYIAGTTPLRSVTTVADFAQAVVMLASDYANALTGQSLSVDGGLTMP